MTGHGCFNSYLHRISRVSFVGYAYCGPTDELGVEKDDALYKIVRLCSGTPHPEDRPFRPGRANEFNVGEPGQLKSGGAVHGRRYDHQEGSGVRDHLGRGLLHNGEQNVENRGGVPPDNYAPSLRVVSDVDEEEKSASSCTLLLICFVRRWLAKKCSISIP